MVFSLLLMLLLLFSFFFLSLNNGVGLSVSSGIIMNNREFYSVCLRYLVIWMSCLFISQSVSHLADDVVCYQFFKIQTPCIIFENIQKLAHSPITFYWLISTFELFLYVECISKESDDRWQTSCQEFVTTSKCQSNY